MKRAMLAILSGLTALGGCASAPIATFSYHPPVLQTAVSVTLTVSCNGDKTLPVYQVATTVTSTYTADKRVTWTVDLPRSAFADVDFNPQFTDDGQLTSISSTLTGQGATTLKDVVAVGVDVAAAGGGKGSGNALPVCSGFLKTPVSIIYDAELDFSTKLPDPKDNPKDDPVPLVARSYLMSLDIALRKQLKDMPSFLATVTSTDDVRVHYADESKNSGAFVGLKLREVVNGQLVIKDSSHGVPVYDSSLAIPRPGDKDQFYTVLLPEPALFGGSVFALNLSAAGAIKSVDYKTTSGTANAIEVGSHAIVAATPSSAAARAADLKAQADVIAQQTRLAKCISTPTSCT
jgi:hypothetical protein